MSSAEEYFNRGVAKQKQGDLQGAIAYYDKAIKLEPDAAMLAGILNNRGLAKQKQGDLQGAITDYDKAIELNPDLAEVWNNRGLAKQEQGDMPGAIADYDEAIKLKSDLVAAWYNRGAAKQKQGDIPGAIADYDKAIELNPDLAEAWNNRGLAKKKQGDLRGAISDYDKAIELNPDLAEAWNSRGVAKQKQGDLRGAISDYDKAIELNPDLAEAWNNRGLAKREQGDLRGAIADYDKAIELKSDLAEAWNNRGLAKQEQGDLRGAIADYDKAIELKSDLAEAWNNRGLAKQEQGNMSGAIADYDKAIELKSDLADAWNNRGLAKQEQGNMRGAIADYDKAIELKSDLAEAWNNRGLAKQGQGDISGAIADYDKAIELNPDVTEAWINRSAVIAVVMDAKRNVEREKVEQKQMEIWGIFEDVCRAINKLDKALKENVQFKDTRHYTNLNTLRNLAKGGEFRLYNVASMKDKREGNALFDLFDKKNREKIRSTFSAKRSGDLEVFIGSFAIDSNSDYDSDLMWQRYGKHNGKKRAGCALVFDKEQHFSPSPPPLINLLAAWPEGRPTVKEQNKSVSQKECYLYPVCYKPNKKIQCKVNDLGKVLVQLCEEEYKETRKIVAVLLNLVRYMFKHDTFQREKEYRLTIRRVRKSRAITKDARGKYVKYPLDMREVTVLLGSGVKEAELWKQCLKGSFKEIETIKRPLKTLCCLFGF